MTITVENLSYSYKNQPVLKQVTFRAEPGMTAVLGPNGVGKSTLFKCMLGLEKGYSGSICFGTQETSDLSPRQLAGIAAYIPQSSHPTFGYRVFDVVLMGTSGRLAPFSVPGKREHQAACQALETVGIAELAQRDYRKLSGGEQQLVLIARALAQQTEVLIMDEPTANLDYGNQIRVLETVQSLAKQGYTVLMSTHNPQNALTYADRVLALYRGRVQADGAPREVLSGTLIRTLYGIETNVEGDFIIPGRSRT
ncbi:MAG: ABC transporter ATP-binding protein [Clostridiales bacterium]|nr:ABC transporter ATP-binding protein [Candidatus Cacconaster stercorequi]